MQEHYIVCGYGHVGRQVVEELHANEIRLVVVDVDRSLGAELSRWEFPLSLAIQRTMIFSNWQASSARLGFVPACLTTRRMSLSF